MAAPEDVRVININVGVLGHVDSGKTHLVRVLSTKLSTAALDKHPQSQERGMTLDLGFSSFRIPRIGSTASPEPEDVQYQITLVDCPGHASLFKTILGGVHIIDAVILVVDVVKGLQPQTIECLLWPFGSPDAIPMVPVAAAPSSSGEEVSGLTVANSPIGINLLIETLQSRLVLPTRDASGPLGFAVDHCFAIPGNGTILTGTVLSGSVRVGDEVELPGLQVTRKVKSMQMFRRSVTAAAQGDRVAIKVHGLDASLVERAMVVTPQTMPFVSAVIVPVHQVPFFQGNCKTGGKFHATIGHTTVVALATFFAEFPEPDKLLERSAFNAKTLYRHVEQFESMVDNETPATGEATASTTAEQSTSRGFQGFALLQFESPVVCPPRSIVVCSRLDLDPKRHHCRLAFHGEIQSVICHDDDEVRAMAQRFQNYSDSGAAWTPLSELRIGKIKERSGIVDKTTAASPQGGGISVIGRDMFDKHVDWQVYADTIVLFDTARSLGRILGPFGKSGKFRLSMVDENKPIPSAGERILLRFVKRSTLRPLGKAVIERLKGETSKDGRNPFAVVVGLFENESDAAVAIGQRVVCRLSDSQEESGEIEKPFGKAGKVRVSFEAIGGTLAQPGDKVEYTPTIK
ncbi:hypothetical protein P43SY_001143 [Pythium insidiosum]|uniref:Elongation factor Tu, chloroplastic n=1 Tax=Pythium insidiosum TaxID=114742 RepID=A0AAD5MGR5_PYTIN|nr:hypothetical protein P43SY_001143 [Pythium insidiosum]